MQIFRANCGYFCFFVFNFVANQRIELDDLIRWNVKTLAIMLICIGGGIRDSLVECTHGVMNNE